MLETAQFTGEFLWAAKKLPLIYWYYCCLAVKGAVTSLWYFLPDYFEEVLKVTMLVHTHIHIGKVRRLRVDL